MSRPAELGSVKEGSYIIIDDEPCKVVSREHFKPGKHGSAKVRLVAISLFTGSKKSYVSPAESRVDIPMIDKRSGQVTTIMDNTVQIMDLQTFEVLETAKPSAEEMAELNGTLAPGAEVEYWTMLGRNRIMRIKGSS
ncbi:MAG: translation initiation factor IF-5A [Nitrososphaerota archaeon]|nr:translation initiation factor IF-5A [Nitrososphaerota archaeon]MDG6953297.1 translation initiation factor IF-5A [Nitrososphaerota archaeon]MDG6956480.1 translation initiation factor IF-5A [Nitrososphaerota archaeon]MDG6960316.1 translation initiation factor IF-5A [Nitrososphaerota archaeon]MDG6966007.1 translation initiation factor IF-5A [Nitrososphaerota archaeon]